MEVRSLECMSHKDANYKSYKLDTSNEDLKKLFSSDIWPSGICVRQYTPPYTFDEEHEKKVSRR